MRLRNALKRVFSRHREETAEPQQTQQAAPREKKNPAPRQARPVQRQADIPLDMLDRDYTPPITSSKESFRSDGSDKHRDQELTQRNADERWNDEDHYTNKSGDPRIGTHRRTYEPDENRAESRD